MRKQSKKSAAPKRGTIAAVATRAILAGKDTGAVIAAVKKTFPKAKTTAASVAWYRHDLRERGETVPDATRAKSKGERQ